MKLKNYFYGFVTALVIALVTNYLLSANAHTRLFQNSVFENSIAQVSNNPKFALPIECKLDKDCFILLYSDRDPSPKELDFGCGRQTYDGHKGTDFAIPDEKIMAQGVAVTAVAPGKVLRTRDGIPDRRIIDTADRDAVKNIECGNGIVIDHGNGWEAQYCHLRNGSVVVKPGTVVKAGTQLGIVGTSGLSSFPHVHLSVRYQGEIVDPFVGVNVKSGCNVPRNSIWEEPLSYKPTGIIRSGFATVAPTMDDLWSGKFYDTVLAGNSAALIFWVQIYGVLPGDKEHYQLFAPNGEGVIDNKKEMKSAHKTWMGYVGKRNNSQSLPIGKWRGEYSLTRGDQVLVNITKEVQLN
ncbi:peptidase M23B [Trichodesmium erythraeum IMS101]|uniref:Peptidase M23B n=1 Tax=Trichodesmium erythraeum (strain IMS101) TaxID=203124 RepID=Q111R6_TRIEI|nr:M23 family metallopeptidase [Trichodesmium erythraeum GBRTRLIN201]